jgi:hypothetical protein
MRRGASSFLGIALEDDNLITGAFITQLFGPTPAIRHQEIKRINRSRKDHSPLA